jgi:tRNA(adenine34) deaminase
VDSVFRLLEEPRLNHRIPVAAGVLREECGAILTQFFRKKRGQPDADV